MRVLSIRQPYAELTLRGIKRIEYRSRGMVVPQRIAAVNSGDLHSPEVEL